MTLNYRQSIDKPQLAAISRLFSARVIQEISRKGKSPLFSRLMQESQLMQGIDHSEPIRNFFDTAFSLLKKKGNRNEYVYKAALTHKVLLGAHSLKTASMLSEFRVGECKADVVILNGTSTVYEIKSERDNLCRLQAQLAAYRQVFAKVNVITCESHLTTVLDSIPEDVGVLLLSGRYQISSVRDAVEDPNKINPTVLFDSLQMHEARLILDVIGINVPSVPNTQTYKIMREIFSDLEPVQVHSKMVAVLKKTRSLKPLSKLYDSLPRSLHAAVFSTALRQSDHGRLLNAMDIPLNEAMNWR